MLAHVPTKVLIFFSLHHIAFPELPRAIRAKAPVHSQLHHFSCIVQAEMKNTVKPCFPLSNRLAVPLPYIRETSLPVPPSPEQILPLSGLRCFLLPTGVAHPLEKSLPRTIHCFSTGATVGRKSRTQEPRQSNLRVITSTEKNQVHIQREVIQN